jgi:hypothetical protein
MKKKHLIPIMLIFIGLATISFMAKDGITLRLRPQQDKTYTITTKANTMTVMEVQGQSMNQTQVLETRQIFKPKTVTEAQSVLETQIEAVKMSLSQMGMKLEYDSEHPEKNSPMLAGQTKEMEKYLNQSVTVTYDALGNLVGDSINLEMNQLSSAIIELPEQELSVGSTWNSNKTQSIGKNEIEIKMNYTVTAVSKKSVDVSFIGTIESKDIEGTYEGTASLNPQTGLISKSSTKSNFSMTIEEQGLSIPMTTVGNTTIEVK